MVGVDGEGVIIVPLFAGLQDTGCGGHEVGVLLECE